MIDETLFEAEEKMEKAVEVAKEDFAGIRTGRANPGMFNKLMVDYYGAPDPAAAAGLVPDPGGAHHPDQRRSTSRAHARDREDAARLRPRREPQQRRQHHPLVLPQLTEERRKEYVKLARHKAEDAKVSIRNIRRKAKDELDRLVKDGEVGEDEGTRAEKELDDADQEVRRLGRRPAQAQGGRAARGLRPRAARPTPPP